MPASRAAHSVAVAGRVRQQASMAARIREAAFLCHFRT